MSTQAPIGIFDSGVGGLSVLRELRRELPQEDFLYVADSAHAPYGDKSGAEVVARSLAVAEFLVRERAKAIVVACNTATGAAVAALRERYEFPVIGMEPAVKPAVQRSGGGVVGVLATRGTLASGKFADLVTRFGREAKILVQACPGWVEQVEAGDLTGVKTRALVERHLRPLLEQGVDTLVLGCTHFPFLAPTIQRIAGAAVAVIDPSPAVARETRRRLAHAGQLADSMHAGVLRFYSSAAPAVVGGVISQLWGEAVTVQPLP